MLSLVEHAKSFITSGPDYVSYNKQKQDIGIIFPVSVVVSGFIVYLCFVTVHKQARHSVPGIHDDKDVTEEGKGQRAGGTSI